jgi:hypothetical protein
VIQEDFPHLSVGRDSHDIIHIVEEKHDGVKYILIAIDAVIDC